MLCGVVGERRNLGLGESSGCTTKVLTAVQCNKWDEQDGVCFETGFVVSKSTWLMHYLGVKATQLIVLYTTYNYLQSHYGMYKQP